jgi:hypothetical protein
MKKLLPIIVASSLIKLVLIWTGACERGLLADDAYYYFTIARNMANGLGPTFDGIGLTNGFHPLWQLLIVPFFLPPGLWVPVHLALTVTVLFDILSGVLIFRITRRITLSDTATAIACILWAFFPSTLLGLRGMESSLSVLTVLLSMHFTLAALDTNFSMRSSVVSGVALALAGLARTDNLPCLAVATAGVVLFAAHDRKVQQSAWRWWLCQGVIATILVAPWFVWNWREFGMLVQVSGQIKLHAPGLFGALPPWEDSFGGNVRVLGHRLLAPLLTPMRFLLGEEFHAGVLTPILTLIVAGLFLVPISLAAVDLGRSQSTRPVFVFAGGWLLTHVVLFSFVWSSYASWYALVPMALLAILVAAACVTGALARRRWTRSVTLSALSMVAIVIYIMPLARHTRETTPPDTRFGARLATVEGLTPEPVLGAFNAGALGYLATSRYGLTVVNLDGLVNNRVYEALKAHRYVEYVEETVDIMFEDPKRAAGLVTADDVMRLDDMYRRQEDQLWHRVPPRGLLSR